jgi:hypothetical protein
MPLWTPSIPAVLATALDSSSPQPRASEEAWTASDVGAYLGSSIDPTSQLQAPRCR